MTSHDNVTDIEAQLRCYTDDGTHRTRLIIKAAATITTLRKELSDARSLLADAPQPYEYMNKAAFKELPYQMRSFVDAHKTWLAKAEALKPQP